MKKVLLTAIAVFAFGFANAQESTGSTSEGFSKSDIFITGSVGYGSSKQANLKETRFNFSPKAGYFVTDKIAVGLALNVGSYKDDNGFDEMTKYNYVSAGAFGRYYFTPASKFSIFGQLEFDYTSTKTSYVRTNIFDETFRGESKTNGFNVALAPGVNYALSNHFALEATWGILRYNTDKPDEPGFPSRDTFEIGLDLSSLNFGLLYKF